MNIWYYFGISSIPQGIETPTPWSNESSISQSNDRNKDDCCSNHRGQEEKVSKFLFAEKLLQVLQEGNSIQQRKDPSTGHMFTCPHRLKAHKGDLHTQDQSKNKESSVSRINSVRETSHQQKDKDVKWY
jgi:hypothetical protein